MERKHRGLPGKREDKVPRQGGFHPRFFRRVDSFSAGDAMKTEKATFAAGCFWGIEAAFRKVPGVISTRVGYMGGKMKNPTYEDVCTDKTGHAEAVEVVFNPKKVSYEELLEIFWSIHDPTQLNSQGPDIGTQYRSVIFYNNKKQKQAAIKSKERMQASQKFRNKKIVTAIEPAKEFYEAEEYHQRYYEKHGKVC